MVVNLTDRGVDRPTVGVEGWARAWPGVVWQEWKET